MLLASQGASIGHPGRLEAPISPGRWYPHRPGQPGLQDESIEDPQKVRKSREVFAMGWLTMRRWPTYS